MEKMTMSVDEMAVALGISRPKAYELTKRAGFPSINVGRRIVISKLGLERWLDQQAQAQQDA